MILLLAAFIGGMVAHHFIGQKIEDKLKGMLDKIKNVF